MAKRNNKPTVADPNLTKALNALLPKQEDEQVKQAPADAEDAPSAEEREQELQAARITLSPNGNALITPPASAAADAEAEQQSQAEAEGGADESKQAAGDEPAANESEVPADQSVNEAPEQPSAPEATRGDALPFGDNDDDFDVVNAADEAPVFDHPAALQRIKELNADGILPYGKEVTVTLGSQQIIGTIAGHHVSNGQISYIVSVQVAAADFISGKQARSVELPFDAEFVA